MSHERELTAATRYELLSSALMRIETTCPPNMGYSGGGPRNTQQGGENLMMMMMEYWQVLIQR